MIFHFYAFKHLVRRNQLCEVLVQVKSGMNKLPVIGSLCLSEDFWDRDGTNSVSCWREISSERLLRRPQKRFEPFQPCRWIEGRLENL